VGVANVGGAKSNGSRSDVDGVTAAAVRVLWLQRLMAIAVNEDCLFLPAALFRPVAHPKIVVIKIKIIIIIIIIIIIRNLYSAIMLSGGR